jgi:hypothetical protein
MLSLTLAGKLDQSEVLIRDRNFIKNVKAVVMTSDIRCRRLGVVLLTNVLSKSRETLDIMMQTGIVDMAIELLNTTAEGVVQGVILDFLTQAVCMVASGEQIDSLVTKSSLVWHVCCHLSH